MFAEKASPDMDGWPALKVGRAGEVGRAVSGKQPSFLEPWHLEKAWG